MPEHDRSSENWSAQTKFAIVVETAALTEAELAQYCRSKGLYPEQIRAWRDVAIDAQSSSQQAAAAHSQQGRDYCKQIKGLERELGRQDKALAEAAALLILQKRCAPCGRGRGRMTSLPERQRIIDNIDQACNSGARLHRACCIAGVSLNCWYRWQQDCTVVPDRRCDTRRAEPANKLNSQERREILAVCNSARMSSLPPSQIVPLLADEGRYLAS